MAIYALPTSQRGPIILSKKGSFFWNSISTLRPLFHSCSTFQIVSGENISFWYDGWDGLPLFFDHFGPLRQRKISLIQARACPYTLLDAPLTHRQQMAFQKLNSFSPVHGKDKLIWDLSSSGQFSVKSAYTILSQGGKTRSRITSIWKTKVTPSMRVFFFLLLNNRILTHDNLQRRNIPHSQGCVMCPQSLPETIMHLFFRCPFAIRIWTAVSAQVGFLVLRVHDSILETYISSRPADKHYRKYWGTLFLTTKWILWNERNNRTFRDKRATVQVLTTKILQEANLCYAHC